MPMKVKAKKPPSIIKSPWANDDLGGLVDQHKAKRDQAVNAAQRNAADQLLNEVQHRFLRARRFRRPSVHPAFAPPWWKRRKPHMSWRN